MTSSTPTQVSPIMMLLRAIWNAFRASVGAYALSLIVFFGLRLLMGETLTFVALINNMLHLMLLPALVLFPLMLLVRHWYLAAVLVIPFAIVVTDNAPLFLGSAGATPDDATEVTLLTYNLLNRSGGVDAFADTSAIIREADADVVLLQEVSWAASEALSVTFAEDYPHQALHPQQHGTQGQGVLSRYPVTEDRFFQNDLPVRLGHQHVILDVNGVEVSVYNVHPVHPFMVPGLDVSVRSADIGSVIDLAEADSVQMPTLVAGDFNMTPKTADYTRVTTTFDDAFQQVGNGLGYTFPSATFYTGAVRELMPPLARLDYVFHDDAWAAIDAQVWDRSGGGDHRPVFVRLALLENNR